MSERISVRELPLRGLKLLERRSIGDARGWLQRYFCAEELAEVGMHKPLAQINLTFTQRAGTVRGMHFQYPPAAEIKIISCLRGKVFDVAVDVRRGSPTFLQWHAEILAPEAMNSLLIPEGFAHGFQALSDECEMLYFHTATYQAEYESGLHPLDPTLAISWPLANSELSERDNGHPLLTAQFTGVDL